MIAAVVIGATMMVSGTAIDAGSGAGRSFLMLNDQAIEFVGGAPVLGYWRVEYPRNAQNQSIQMVDGVEFLFGKQFWKMIAENDATYSAKREVRVDSGGRLFFHDKPVELGMAVGYLDTVLRWRGWIVAVGTAADKRQATIKGPIRYLLWFDERTLKGGHRQIETVGTPPPLRIYTK